MLVPNSILQNRYRIVRLIGKGGMGAVFEAIDLTFDSAVAIKQTLVADDHFQKAFEREARLLNRLRHRALPVVTDYFFADEGEFLVMQFIGGDDLGAMMKKRAAQEYPQGIAKGFAIGEVLNWADQLLDALEYLHSQNPPIIHRDIKPQNLKLNERGEIILLDFGLAKGATTTQSLAFTSIYGYTPSYAPLEQIQGSGTSIRSDLYSLAATVYNLSTGITPVDALSRATAAIGGKPDPLLPVNRINSKVPDAIAKVIMKGLAQNPEQRPRSAGDMRKALREAASISSTKVSQKSDSAEKGARGNRIVVQLKPDSGVEQKPVAAGKEQQTKASEYEKPVVTKQGVGEDTQATHVRPTKRKPVLPDAQQTMPESPLASVRTQAAQTLRAYIEKTQARSKRTEDEPDRSAKEKPIVTKSKPSLSPRRQEILELLVDGCSDEEIARRLSLDKTQVSEFLTKLRHDTGVITRKDLVLWAMTQVAASRSRKTPETQRPKEATAAERKPVAPPIKTVAPNVRIDPMPPSPPRLDMASLFKPSEKKVEEIVVEKKEQHSVVGNFFGAIVLAFFGIGAAMTLFKEIEKGHTITFGEIVGLIMLAGVAILLGLACLGAVLNFFAALKSK